MNDENPYKTPEDIASPSSPQRNLLKAAGTAVVFVGLAVLAYGAIAFWLINSLPPNGGANGRLPSLYVMGVGIIVVVIGLIARDLRLGRKSGGTADVPKKGIPTSYGVLLLLVLVSHFSESIRPALPVV